MPDKRFEAVILGDNIIVPDIEASRKLYSMGYYGKPLGIDKPKSADFDSPLLLNPLEAVYLSEKGLITIKDKSGRVVALDELKGRVLKNERMRSLYAVYKDLRDSGLIVKPGMKFGADFAVYRYGPGIDHAPYIVSVMRPGEKIDPIEIVRAGRLSHSVRKTFILAVEEAPGRVIYITFKWFKL